MPVIKNRFICNIFHQESSWIARTIFFTEGGVRRDDSIDEILKKQFTKYVHIALAHKRIDYIRHIGRVDERERSVGDFDDAPYAIAVEYEFELDDLPIEEGVLDLRLFEAINALSAIEYDVLNRRFIQGIEVKTIAQELGLSARRIQQIITKIKNDLRQALKTKGGNQNDFS